MYLLPKWALVTQPTVMYDFESLTNTQQVARVYGAMNEMIREYNAFADSINEEFEKFMLSGSAEIDNFKESVEERLRCKFNDLDVKLAQAMVKMMNDNREWLQEHTAYALPTVTNRENGRILAVKDGAWADVLLTLKHDPETESLTLHMEGER